MLGFTCDVPTFSGARKKIDCTNEVVTPKTRKIVANEGLPNHKNPLMKGDLIVTFDIQFPNYFSSRSRQVIEENL